MIVFSLAEPKPLQVRRSPMPAPEIPGMPESPLFAGSAGTHETVCRSAGDVAVQGGDGYAIYFHCQNGLVRRFRELYPDTFTYEGERAMHFAVKDRLPVRERGHCVALALIHHLRKKAKRGG